MKFLAIVFGFLILTIFGGQNVYYRSDVRRSNSGSGAVSQSAAPTPPHLLPAIRATGDPHPVAIKQRTQPHPQPAPKLVSNPKVVPKQTDTIARVSVYNGQCKQYLPYFEKYTWNVQTAVAICQAESQGNPSALSYTCDRGLMQVNCIHADMVDYNLAALYDPATNIAVAYKVYCSQGWYGWTTYTSGAYLKYL